MKIIKILNYIFPLIIGALCSYMGSLTHIGKNNILQIIMIFTLSVIFSILLFYDAKTELDKLQKSYHNNYSNIITKFLILKNIVIQLFAIIICIFRKNRALAPHERSAVPLGTDHCPVG